MSKYTADNITVLDGLEPVRKLPGMYIGSTSRKGLNHLVYEIVDNSVDEHLAGFCKNIYVTLEKDGSVTVEDDGRGIPVDIHKQKGIPAERVILTTLHAGGKFDNNTYKTSGGLHGVGSSVVNALSEFLDIKIKKDGVISHDRYERGVPTIELEKNKLPVIGKTKESGTIINFKPDALIFTETTKFKASAILQRLHETAYLNPELTIYFENKRDNLEKVILHEPEGIKGFIKNLTVDKITLTDIIYWKSNKDNVQVELAFCYIDDMNDELLGFCNNIHTEEGGTHITGFQNGYVKLINQYARNIGVLKEKDSNFTGKDTRSGMVGVIVIKHPTPRFEGQTKTKLDNQDVLSIMNSIVNTEGQLYFDRHLEELKIIIAQAEKAAKLRKAEEKNSINLNDKKFAFEGNGKLARQESNDPKICEIFIVEGDSAGGSAKMARQRFYQAIMPIRGKILNVEKQSIDKVLANAEIRSMILAFGCGFGDNFDISKLKYDKIIIMSDADIDGDHISTLLLTFFFRFMPELIRQGKVYRAMPPLYKIEQAKGEDVYLYNDVALKEYKKAHKGNLKVQRYKGLGEMDAQQLWDTTLNPETRKLKRIEIEDAIEASNLVNVLMGSQVEPRREFIINEAKFANIH